MFKPVAMRFHGVFVMNFEPLPAPAVRKLSHILHHPRDVVEHALERARKRQMANVREAFLYEGRPDNGQGFESISVGNVLSLEQKKREPKHVIAVNVGYEHGLHRGDVHTVSTKPGQRRGGSVDDVALVEHGEGVVAAVRQEGITCSQHVDAMGHDVRNTCAFLFPSVASVCWKDANVYQG